MADDPEYDRLRRAAIRLLDEATEAGERPPGQVRSALEELREALGPDAAALGGADGDAQRAGRLAGAQPADPYAPVLDPFRHVLSVQHYTDDAAEPITLEQHAAAKRRSLDNDRPLDEHLPGMPPRNITITELRAMVIAGLLHELAARISPGPAFGPGREGAELAQVARDLAEELLADTFVGPL